MRRRTKSGKHDRRIVIDIDGVTWDTPMGELTVEQFVELVFQLVPQLPTHPSQQEKAAIADKVLSAIREGITRRSHGEMPGINRAVQDAQLAMLDRMPNIMREAFSAGSRRSREVKK